MSAEFTVQTDGLANVIVRLNKLDPGLRREIQKQMKDVASPLVTSARSLLPAASPLDNWGNWGSTGKRLIGRYDRSAAARGIKVTYKGSSDSKVIPLLTFTQTNAVGAIVDLAGRAGGTGRRSEGARRGREMIGKLNRSLGREASRTMYPAVIQNLPKVFRELEQAIAEVEEQFRKQVYDLV